MRHQDLDDGLFRCGYEVKLHKSPLSAETSQLNALLIVLSHTGINHFVYIRCYFYDLTVCKVLKWEMICTLVYLQRFFYLKQDKYHRLPI